MDSKTVPRWRSKLRELDPIVFNNTVGSIGFFEIVELILFAFVIILGLLMWNNRDTANIINRLGATRAGVWAIKHVVSPLQRWVYASSGGRVFSKIGSGRNVLLLTTKGRRTGVDRTNPVFYLRDGELVIICNVNPGFERTNPWVINLRANPIARIQIGKATGLYQARPATDAEVERYWPKLVAIWPAYQSHFAHGGRRSIFILEKRD